MKTNIFNYKTVALAALLLCLAVAIHPQSSDRNYILTKTMLDNTGAASLDRIDYFDGLGRGEQTVLKKASPGQKDIVTLQEYDNAGRESNHYLPVPVTTATGAYVAPSAIKTASNGFYGDAHAYEKPVYEASPLERVTEKYGPGAAWHTGGKAVETAYMVNTASGALSCALYMTDFSSMLVGLGEYPAGTLLVTQTTGEDGQVSYTFTDKQGQTLLERVMEGTVAHDTYYVYDNLGQLRYVLPPPCDAIDAATLDAHAYRYDYDIWGNCIWKKLPGCEPVEMKYDQADRMIFSRDGNQRSGNEWTFYLYDAFGRPAVTGTCPAQVFTTFEATVVKATYDGGTALGGYTVTPALSGSIKLMTVHYYDNYAFINTLTAAEKPKMAMVTLSGYDNAYPSNTAPDAKGLLTGSRTYRLDDPSKYSVSAMYYDHRGRVVQTHASNHLEGFEDEYFAYTFTGKVRQRQLVHSAPGKTTQTEVYVYGYGTPATNPSERLLSVTHKLNSAGAVTIAQYTYDDVGRVKTKKLGTETSTHSYNVRSWLTQITGTKFNQTLTYNTAVNGITPSTPTYSGNISAMKWKSGDETAERGYKFSYDGMDRLADAIYGEGAAITSNPNRFNEALSYDKGGNITALQRRGKLDSGYGVMDNLTYTYTGNKLTKVTDAATPSITYPGAFHFVDRANVDNEYTYDANGNLKKDLNRNITLITYNELNLPNVITFADGNTVTYGYDAAGSKLSVAYQTGTGSVKMEYAGNKVYNNGTLSMILTEEGYATLSGTTPAYHYYLKDHQGNNRVVINQSGTVLQVNHYYPFGGLFGEGVQTVNQRYRYNGKELDRELGLDMYDYGARHYDAALGRWFTVDPLAEKYYSISPYVYVANNPIKYIDPDGRDVWEINNQGRIINRIEDKTQDAFYMVSKDTDGNYQRTYTTDAEGNKKYNSVSFEYGTVESQRSISFSPDGKTTDTYDAYQVRGDDNGTNLFEFMSTNTAVEWSQAKTGIAGDKGLNFITTSHEQSRESGMSNLYTGQLYAGYTIRELNHSHPGNTAYPSGLPGSRNAGGGDIGFSRSITNNRQANGLNVPIFRIFLPGSKSYINYNPNSIRSNYGR